MTTRFGGVLAALAVLILAGLLAFHPWTSDWTPAVGEEICVLDEIIGAHTWDSTALTDVDPGVHTVAEVHTFEDGVFPELEDRAPELNDVYAEDLSDGKYVVLEGSGTVLRADGIGDHAAPHDGGSCP